MKNRHMSAGLALSILLTAPGAAAEPPSILAPNSKWLLDYNDTSCRLFRSFGTGRDIVTVQINQYQINDSFELRLIGDRMKLLRPRPIQIRFGDEKPRETNIQLVTMGKEETPAIIMHFGSFFEVPEGSSGNEPADIYMKRVAQIDHLSADISNRSDFVLQTGSMGPPMQAMHNCTLDLVKSWGFDPATIEPATQAKIKSGMPSHTDYPSEMIAKGRNGKVYIALVINDLGKVEKCHVQSLVDDPEFARVTCDVMMKRAKFEPARDADGKAVRSLFQTSVTFLIAS